MILYDFVILCFTMYTIVQVINAQNRAAGLISESYAVASPGPRCQLGRVFDCGAILEWTI